MNMWKQIREEHHLTQQEVADILNCSRQYVHAMETGKKSKSKKYQIFILELRGNKQDLINAKYLRELDEL